MLLISGWFGVAFGKAIHVKGRHKMEPIPEKLLSLIAFLNLSGNDKTCSTDTHNIRIPVDDPPDRHAIYR
jgi:hypothetical protein